MKKIKKLLGIGASGGFAVGRLHFFNNEIRRVQQLKSADCEVEMIRFELARVNVVTMLEAMRERARVEAGPKEAMIFEIHHMILEDPDFSERVRRRIMEDHYIAEYAVQMAGDELAGIISGTQDAYMRERRADVIDVANGIIRHLRGEKTTALEGGKGQWIIAARHLLPSEIIRIERGRVLAVVTSEGSRVSHACILARTMGVPAVTGLGGELYEMEEGATVIVNGFTGEICTDPDEKTLAAISEKWFGPPLEQLAISE